MLNLLRSSRLNLRLSTYEHLQGTFDFNRTPLVPPGCRAIIHERPEQQKSWDPHGKAGFYVVPTKNYYHCYEMYVAKTGCTRISETVDFSPSTAKCLTHHQLTPPHTHTQLQTSYMPYRTQHLQRCLPNLALANWPTFSQ
jgi:hypothetical protein